VICCADIIGDIDWQPASIASAPASTAPDHTHFRVIVFMNFLR
jgi:hypothetical protein